MYINYANNVLAVSKTGKCEYVPTYLQLFKCEYTAPSLKYSAEQAYF